MRTENRIFVNPAEAGRLLQAFDAKEKGQAAGQPSPSGDVVREARQRTATAVEGLRGAYSGDGGESAQEVAEPRESGRFIATTDAAGSPRLERFDPSSPEVIERQLKASTERAQRLTESYYRALIDIAQADEEIRALQEEERQLNAYGGADVAAGRAYQGKRQRIVEDLAAWTQWRDGRSKSVAQYSREFTQNEAQLASVREIKRLREAQSRLPDLRKEYQALFQKSEEYWQTLEANEAELALLQDQLAKAMAQAALEQPAEKPRKRDIWAFFRAFRGDGVEARSPEYGATTEAANGQVQAILVRIGEKNRQIEALTMTKTRNDLRLQEIGAQIQEIESPTVPRAA